MIEARGKDKRGNGTATANVTASFAESGEQTDVEVLTDLAITGKPAQFGRGVISDVSDRLLDQFLACVSGRFTEGLGAAEEAGPNGRQCRAQCLQRMPTPDSMRRTPSRPSSSKPCPAAAASSEVGSSSGADVAPPVPDAATPAAPPGSEPSRY